MKKAVYAGSFDPITNGHLEVLKRSLKIFDEVYLLLAVNPKKRGAFTIEERLSMMRDSVKDMPNVKVDYYDGLTVDYCKKVGAPSIIRGLRAVSDFEYEGATVMMAPAAGFYTTPGAGRDQVRIAYVLKKEDLNQALLVLRKALEAYPGRTANE